nr:MAG TPA: prohead serine protease [Caudoviricetes sp.]
MDEKREKREVRNTGYQVTVDKESRRVEGYALLFESVSDGLPFREIIMRGSLDGVLEKSNIFALLDHDKSRGILARWKGAPITLFLEIDTRGLKYWFDAPNTSLGDELLECIHRKEITESSFSFIVSEDEWKKAEDGVWERKINKYEELFDISPVYDAAFSKTSVYTRGREQAEEELRKQEERESACLLDEYYEKINKSLNI